MFDRLREELLERDAVATDRQLSLRSEGRGEGFHPRVPFARTPTLDLVRRDLETDAHDEVYLMITVAPVVYFERACRGGVSEMSTDRRFDDSVSWSCLIGDRSG